MVRRFRKPYRIRKKKSVFKILFKSRLFWLIILVLLIFGSAFYFLIFSTTFQIKKIQISGNQKIQTQDINNFLNQKINQKLFFQTKSVFLVNIKKIKNSFLETFPQAEGIKVKRKLPSILVVQVQERSGVGAWCRGEDCYSIDRRGVIFEKVNEGYSFVIRFGNEKEPFLGEQILKENQMEDILKIQENLTTKIKLTNKEFVLVNADRINVKTSEDWEIYFNLKENLDWQLTKLKLTLEKEIPLERRGSLEYIDLRFGNFVPFKYRGAQPQGINQNSI